MIKSQELVGWSELKRGSKHRTSAPTDRAVRIAASQIATVTGRRPLTDAVFLAALRLAGRDPQSRAELAAEVLRIEREEHNPQAVTK